MAAPNFVAGGNIAPASFVKVSTAADNTVLQAGAGEFPIGVATPSPKAAPVPNASTLAAISGDGITVFGLGDICLLTAGTAGYTHGDKLKADASGYGTQATTGDYIGAIALETVAANCLGRVQVVIFKN